MAEQDKATSLIMKSETDESKDKIKDKIKDNNFNVIVNNFNESSKEHDSNKKKPINEIYRNFSFKNYFNKMNRRFKINSQDKESNLNNNDLLTIINASQLYKHLPNFLFSKKKVNHELKKKRKFQNVDMFFSKKFKNIEPQKDYNLGNNSFSLLGSDSRTSKNNSVKLKNSRILPRVGNGNSSSSSVPKKLQHKKIDNNNKSEGMDSLESQVTCYLDRKKINDLPILYPLFLSYNNSYETFSEKNRVEKILNKFICLKTQITKDYKNRDKILKEFMIKNGVCDKKYFTEIKMSNFNEYLKKPFKFDPKKTIIDIINEAVNYKYINVHGDENELKSINMFNNHNVVYRNKHIMKKNTNSTDNIHSEIIYKNPICLNFNERKYNGKNVPELVKELETNLRDIKFESTKRMNMLKGANKTLKKYIIKDNNKLVPNLCLVNPDFKEKYDNIIDKENKKLEEKFNKYQLIQNINDRMYYNNIKKRFTEHNFSDEIRRKLKLTEYIYVQRAKKKMYLDQFKKIMNDLDKE
jgi:hypothetical protein